MHSSVYELGDLADYVDLAPGNRCGSGANLDDSYHSRHCMLFEFVRHYAYSIVNRERTTGNSETFSNLVEVYAHSKNSFRQFGFTADLASSSIRATVRSIARWTWDRYTGSRRANLGVMQLDGQLPLAERQRLSAERTHNVRAKATEAKIRAACRVLKGRGDKLTQIAVAKLSRLTRQTIASYKHVVEAIKNAPASVTLVKPVAMPMNLNVKNGAYQVSAGFSVSVDFGNQAEMFDSFCSAVYVFDG